jgi:hypothetical protein
MTYSIMLDSLIVAYIQYTDNADTITENAKSEPKLLG